jgi:hypothetical protein
VRPGRDRHRQADPPRTSAGSSSASAPPPAPSLTRDYRLADPTHVQVEPDPGDMT